MTRTWVFLRKPEQTEEVVIFSVESPDFSDDGLDQLIGKVVIDKSSSTYCFIPMGAWIHEDFIPPEIWGIPEKERVKIIALKYGKAKFLPYSYSIHQAVVRRMTMKDWQ